MTSGITAITLMGSLVFPPATSTSLPIPLGWIGSIPSTLGHAISSLFGPPVALAAEPEVIRREMVDARARDEKVYDNRDGTLTSVFSRDLHYLAGPGQWEDVDLNFRRVGADDVADRAATITRVSTRGVTVTDHESGEGIRWLTPVRPQVTGRVARFSGQGGLSWTYATHTRGVKLTTTVASRQGPRLYTFPYEKVGSVLPLVMRSDGSLIRGPLRIPPPSVLGADAQTHTVGGWIALPGQIAFMLDDTAYPEAAFPYQIDPTTVFEVAADTNDGFAHGAGATYQPPCSTIDSAGTVYLRTSRKKNSPTSWNIDNGLMRWTTASLPDTATINGARLKVRVTNVWNADSRGVTADWFTNTWNCTSAYSTNALTTASGATSWALSTMTPNTDRSFTLVNADTTNISRTGTTGLRSHISGGTPTGLNEAQFAAYPSTAIAPTLEVDYDNAAPATPSPVAPDDLTFLDTATPTLSASGSDPDGDAISFQFQTATDFAFTQNISTSAWLPSTPTYTPAPGTLTPETTYYWRVKTKDRYLESKAWSLKRSFTIRPASLGDAPNAPMWSYGPVQVNRATGNLVVPVGGPSLPSPGSGAAVSASFNSVESSTTEFGAGWRMSAGDAAASPPAALLDRTIALPKLDAIEVLDEDGDGTIFSHAGTSPNYLPPPEEDGSVTKGSDNTFVLSYPDGSRYTFSSANATTGEAELTGVEVVGDPANEFSLTHQFSPTDPSKVTSITAKDARTLTFTWNSLNPTGCADAIVCVTDPESIVWRYVGAGAGGTTGRLAEVHRGTRVLQRFTYSGSNLTEVRTANDVTPADASPGYDAAHYVRITYDTQTPPRVTEVRDGPMTIAGATGQYATYALTYLTGGTTAATAQVHTGLPAGSTRTAVGRTQLTLPGGGTETVFHDDRAREIQATDALGRITQRGYDARGHVLWEEDAAGGATDNTFDPATDWLLSTDGPDPDGTGPSPRPTTTNRYDETAAGTAVSPGPALAGLQTANHDNNDLTGEPKSRTTSGTVDFNWGTGAPSGLPTDNFSVRYSGLLDITQAGDYLFAIQTADSDGARLSVGGVSAIDAWAAVSGNLVTSEKVNLTVGRHRITLDYRDLTGAAEVHLRYQCDACGTPIAEQLIPATALRPAYGNQTSVVDPAGNVSFNHFDDPAAARNDYDLTTLGDGTQMITSYTYDTLNRVTLKTHPNGNATRTIDANGNLTGSADARYQTTFVYYGASETTAIPAACGGGTSASQAGALKSLTHYGHASQTTVYDAAGRQKSSTDGAGATCTTYDAEGRPSTVTPPSGAATTTTYDAEGRTRNATESSLTVRTDYDERGNQVFTRDASGAEATFRYDAESRLTQRTAAKGALANNTNYIQSYAYDADGQLITLTDPAARVWRFSYDARGGTKTVAYPNATFSWYIYDSAGRLTDLHHRHGTLSYPPPGTEPADVSPIAEETYTYDTQGKRTGRVRSGGGLTTETTDYAYDAAGRLTQVLLPGTPLRTDRRYLFDRSSNRTEIREAPEGVTPASVETYAYDVNNLDRLASTVRGITTTNFTYDTDGNTLTKGQASYTYDARGRHTGATITNATVSYAFDAAGRRRTRTQGATTTTYLYAGSGGALTFSMEAGSIVESAADSPVGDLARYAGPPATATAVSFLYLDGHGTALAEANTAGTRTALLSYDPFGVPLTTPPANTTVEGFTAKWSKRTDTFSTLVEMGARAYDPSLGRFVQVDPVEGGSANLYDYSDGDPVNGWDLDGNCSWRRIWRCFFGRGRRHLVERGGRPGFHWGNHSKRIEYDRKNQWHYNEGRRHLPVRTGFWRGFRYFLGRFAMWRSFPLIMPGCRNGTRIIPGDCRGSVPMA